MSNMPRKQNKKKCRHRASNRRQGDKIRKGDIYRGNKSLLLSFKEILLGIILKFQNNFPAELQWSAVVVACVIASGQGASCGIP